MNRHQVLTGAANNFENSVAIGSVGNNHFTTYGSGGNLIILSSNFDRVQIISSNKHNLNSIIRCLDCTLDTGKIAAAYGNKVFIFEPTPSAKKANHNIHYKWIEIGVIELESNVECVSWNSDGQRILIGCSLGTIQMWSYNPNPDNPNNQTKDDQVKFSISDDNETFSHNAHKKGETNHTNNGIFIKIWETKLSHSVKCVKFSPDGALFASFGQNDRLVKIWHEVLPNSHSYENTKLEFDFIYLAHPRSVTSISWRQITKFMPRGMVSNSLITCCKDNICRIWTETVLPDDGLFQHSVAQFSQQTQVQANPSTANQSIDTEQFNNAQILNSSTPTNSYLTNSKSVRHKKKLFHKLQKMRISSHFPHFTNKTSALNSEKSSNIHNTFSSNSNLSFLTSMGSNNLYSSSADNKQDKASLQTSPMVNKTTLQSTISTNEFSNIQNKIGSTSSASQYQQTISRAFHFHLAGLIDPEAASIPLHLLPNLKKQNSKEYKNFVVHWMQNKDFQFTYLAELFSKEIYQKLKKIYQQQQQEKNSDSNSSSSEDLNELNRSKQNDFNLDSLLNINLDDETKSLLFGNSIDQKLDQMLKDWYSNHDVLFCIHPLDGSILIWLVDWLDENMPGNIYRQAQVSFHAKLPYSFPIGDSISLTNSIFLYIEPVKSSLEITDEDNENFFQSGVVNLVSKHNNGTLNLWRMQFQDNSKYQSLVNVTHLYRVCGHRFRVSDITSHPVLPFLLTNSINDLNSHEISDQYCKNEDSDFYEKFQKGLVIWGVEPVGPLCKSGGIFELARIDSTKPNAFENIAWFPCFLPSSTLGISSASPSTLFASTDASQITIYQAVFDARTLLHEYNKEPTNISKSMVNSSSISSCISSDSCIGISNTTEIPFNSFNIVSIQSTARPGCIIELEKLVDSNISNWTKADLFHIYQENLINDNPKPILNSSNQFDETYFLVLLEKKRINTNKGIRIAEIVHMWKIMISSSPQNNGEKNRLTIKSTRVCEQEIKLPENVYVSCAATAAADLSSSAMFSQNKVPYLFTTACSDGLVRFWTCQFKIGEEYEFFEWKLNNQTTSDINLNGNFPLAISCSYNSRFAVAYKQRIKDPITKQEIKNYIVQIYECESSGGSEWKLEDTISLNNIVLPEIDSGIDFDYIFGNSQPIRPARSSHSFKSILFGASNAPSASTSSNSVSGGTNSNVNYTNLSAIPSSNSFSIFPNTDNTQAADCSNSKTPEIPSTAAKISIKRQFSNNSANDFSQQKPDSSNINYRNPNFKYKKTSLIKLDWASNENGSHLLTIGLGHKIFVYSCKTKDMNINKTKNETSSSIRYQIPVTKDMMNQIKNESKQTDQHNQVESDSLLKWLQVRSFELDSADDQQALPTQMKWVREGLLVIGLDTEMQVYSQWSPITTKQKAIQEEVYEEDPLNNQLKNLLIMSKNHSVLDLNKLNMKLTKDSNSGLSSRKQSKQQSENEPFKQTKTKKIFDESQALELVQDSGLFMHAKNVCPILPQYHPKLLLELMNSGKINRVRAILMHLTRCIIDNEFKTKNKRSISSAEKKLKKRKMSLTNELEIPEEQTLNFLEIDHIPPLPLFQLYLADNQAFQNETYETLEKNKDLFSTDDLNTDLSMRNDDFDFLNDEDKQKLIERQQQQEKLDFKKNLLIESNYNFDQKSCKLLIEYLEYVQLNGLTSTDQMYLVALADTIVNVKSDLKDKKTEDSQDHVVDDCGFKFLLSLRSYNYLTRTLPMPLRVKLKSIGLGTANFAWAFHSECEQDLLNQIITGEEGSVSLKWEDLRQYGIGWWLKTPIILKQLIEKIAKYSYQLKNDPLDSALFYLAMKKKGVLWALFKTAKDTKMSDFFKNDFSEQRWQTAAQKNAYALLGKQRFEHAAAFFLLADRLKNAIEVCIRHLNDIQLALIIVRLYCESNYEEQNKLIKEILNDEILSQKSSDPFLRSMSYWFIKDYKNSLNTLYDIDITHIDSLKSSTGLSSLGNAKDSTISHVFNFYTFLKNHPLVLRQQQTEAQQSKDVKNSKSNEISSVERRLHFISGYYHLINGCPLLSLDVLTRLPKYLIIKKEIVEESHELSNNKQDEQPNFDWTDNKVIAKKDEKADMFDWSAPTFSNNRFKDDELELDLKMSDDDDEQEKEEERKGESERVKEEEIKIPEQGIQQDIKLDKKNEHDEETTNKIVDIFTQQIKFISCLKILIEEMSNLATGFEVIGGQLRYYMYYWLDKETQLLREMGDYQDQNEIVHLISFDEELIEDSYLINNEEEKSNTPNSSSLLHEEVLNNQILFEQKIKRLNKRKSWLRSNELLLRTLLSYCSLHSASAQGLISVKMELLLLMQELIEDRSATMKQLHEPVPIQTTTTIPLLSASIASSKNMLAGPIQMLKRLSTDILSTISSVSVIPTIFDFPIMITTIKEISVSLSSCIYQCLCDSDNVLYRFTEDTKQSKNSYLNAIGMGIQELSRNILYKSTNIIRDNSNNSRILNRKKSINNRFTIQSHPKNWPGIKNLTKLLDRNNEDQEFPKLKILLFESLVAVYASLLLNAFVFYDCSNLYRILSKEWKEKMWNKLFGGATQIEYRYKMSQNQISLEDDENKRQRMKINARLGYRLNSASLSNNIYDKQSQTNSNSVNSDEKVYKREKFVPPEISMVNYFLNKEEMDSNGEIKSLNESDSINCEDSDFESDEIKKDPLDDDLINDKNQLEHMNPKSYSWCMMRYAILKYALNNISSFLPVIGIETNEIAILSPLIHQIMKTFENWMQLILIELNTLHKNGPPEDYLNLDSKSNWNETSPSINFNGPKILKYQSLLDPDNTPFINDKSSFGARRLWNFLVSKKSLHEFFIRNIFKKQNNSNTNNISAYSVINTPQLSSNDNSLKKSDTSNEQSSVSVTQSQSTSFKIVHKDQEGINSFCINERDRNSLALCTGKEIIEMNTNNLLKNKTAPNLIDDENEIEMLAYNSQPQDLRTINDPSVYVIGDNMTNMLYQNSLNPSSDFGANTQNKYNQTNSTPRSLRSNSLANVALKRNLKEVRKLASHPTLPYYLSGTSDGVVKLWNWGTEDPFSTIKQQEKSNSTAKITQILFNSHGNKFGVSDMDGYLHLYQLLGCSFKPYLTLRCYKVINDFLFIESSSILLTIGTSNDSYIISLWDTLMPSNKSLIKSFKEQEIPSGLCAAYSPLSHLAYCGTRKGEVYIYDLRMHKKLSKFTAHESAVKAMALNSDENLMATGSSEGTIKTWNLKTFELKNVFQNEHSKSSLIRNFNSGVNQLKFINDDQLLSCGADGTVAVRNLI